jgi:hypothetical protein
MDGKVANLEEALAEVKALVTDVSRQQQEVEK